jgi:hypothetical protein
MFKKLLIGFIGLAFIFPTGSVDASPITGNSNASITINPGDSGFTQLITNNLFFEPYTISAAMPDQQNTSTHTFKVADFSGAMNGWTVTASFSDFILDTNGDATPEDRLSDHSATIDFNCATTTFNSFPHACQTNISRVLTGSGTAPSVIVSAPANSTSVGEFIYTIPTNFFTLKFDNKVKAGVYNGTLTIDFAAVYTP